MPCLNYIVASLQCAQCQKYAMHICGISFPIWLAVLGSAFLSVMHTHTHIYIHTRSENSVMIMYLALRRSAINLLHIHCYRNEKSHKKGTHSIFKHKLPTLLCCNNCTTTTSTGQQEANGISLPLRYPQL